jgi:hypothetical protein
LDTVRQCLRATQIVLLRQLDVNLRLPVIERMFLRLLLINQKHRRREKNGGKVSLDLIFMPPSRDDVFGHLCLFPQIADFGFQCGTALNSRPIFHLERWRRCEGRRQVGRRPGASRQANSQQKLTELI